MKTSNIRAAAAAILLAGLAVPAAAQAPASKAASSETASRAGAAQDQRVCVRLQLTGTRMSRLVCKTRAEWEREGGVPTAED